MSLLLPQTRFGIVRSVMPVSIHGDRYVDLVIALEGSTDPPVAGRVGAADCPESLAILSHQRTPIPQSPPLKFGNIVGRAMLASFGKMPTTSARRLTSLFKRSNGLVECSLVRCGVGKAI